MHSFRDNEVLLQAGYDVIVIYLLGIASGKFSWRILKERPYVFHSVPYINFYLGCMVSEITRFYCKLDMTSSWFFRQGALQAIFHDGFSKSDHDFLIAFHTNVLSRIHGFRDNEVLLPTGNDVIVISTLGGVSHRFCWSNGMNNFRSVLKKRVTIRFVVLSHCTNLTKSTKPIWLTANTKCTQFCC